MRKLWLVLFGLLLWWMLERVSWADGPIYVDSWLARYRQIPPRPRHLIGVTVRGCMYTDGTIAPPIGVGLYGQVLCPEP